MIELNWKTVRFIVIGVLGALVYFFCSYLLLSYTELPAFLASLFAYACSFGFSYLGQKVWAFRSIAPHSVTLFRYAVLQACCATFAAIFTQVSVLYSDWSALLLSGLAAVLTSGISYIVSSRWVFTNSSEQSFQSAHVENIVYRGAEYQYWPSGLWALLWVSLSTIYVTLYYYMPLAINLAAEHDDNLFVTQAYSLAAGDWLGKYSQFTLMKGPGYSLFLALTHFMGLPLYFITAIFHIIAVSSFAGVLYRLSQSRLFSILVFVLLLLLPLVISNGRIIRDQIYPDQFLLGFAALIFSFFIADSWLKRSSSALLAGLMFAWFWLTREEGVWIVPSVVLLTLFAIWRFWRINSLKQGLISSVLVLILAFSSVHIIFQLINWHIYERFAGLDIKEKNFQSTLSALQSVRVGEPISHVPVSQETRQHIYRVSPAFAELKHYFSHSVWENAGCPIYPWACKEIAGGWFIWALRDAAATQGYYQSPAQAAAFFARVATEINRACTDGRLICEKSLVSYMPRVVQQDIDQASSILEQLLDVLLLSHYTVTNSTIKRTLLKDEQSLLRFLHSEYRFVRDSKVEVFGRYADDQNNKGQLNLTISNQQGIFFPYRLSQASISEKNKFYPFRLETSCPEGCTLTINIDGKEKLKLAIPDFDQVFTAKQVITLGGVKVFFEKVMHAERQYKAVTELGERTTYKLRQVLLVSYQSIFPVLLYLGLISFAMLTIVAIKQRNFSVLFVINAAMWGAMLVRLTILFLIHISSFPTFNPLYFMPVYSLLIIAPMISLYLWGKVLYKYFGSFEF